jgi:aminomethyltransferase
MTTTSLMHTALHDWHVGAGARMIDFAGWSMPIQYGSIIDEHIAARTAAALFDISHMGRLSFEGESAAAFLDKLLTRRVADMAAGQIKYGLVTNEAGGILDDVLVYRMPSVDDRPFVYMVVNASNRQKILAWINRYQPQAAGVRVVDQTHQTCMLAVQGPQAISIANPLLDIDVASIQYYRGTDCRFGTTAIFCSRTGYTGEDGCELIVPASAAEQIWQQLLEAGAGQGIRAAGLAARDTLRLEAAMPLYGHELSEDINPYQAGLGFAVNLKDREFVGKAAVLAAKDDHSQTRRIGLVMDGRRAAREGYGVYDGDRQVGTVTSGTFSPTLDRPIAMAYVSPDVAAIGRALEVDLRGQRLAATVVELPFYDRNRQVKRIN